MERYSRQVLFQPIGREGQEKLGRARVLLVGCGALGSVLAEILVRAGAGVVTGVNHIKGHDEHGQTFDVKLSFTDTYIKRHGRWQAWASQHTRVRL